MSKKYVLNPELKTIKAGFPGNLLIDDSFTNTSQKERPLLKEIIRWIISPNPQRKEKKNDPFRVTLKKGADFLNTKGNFIVWLGHASFYIRIDEVSNVTDPVFFDLPFIKRKVGLPCQPEEIMADYILLSHCHRDHLDYRSLKILIRNNPHVEILAPLQSSALIRNISPELKIQESGWYQQYNTKPEINIDFLPAIHWNRRGAFDFNKELWGSFMISSGK